MSNQSQRSQTAAGAAPGLLPSLAKSGAMPRHTVGAGLLDSWTFLSGVPGLIPPRLPTDRAEAAAGLLIPDAGD